MRKSFFSVLLLCVGVQFCSAAVRIIENTPRRLSFEWTTDHVSIIQNPGIPSQLSFAGANIDLGENNEPIIPAYSFYIGVPPQGDAGMSFAAGASHSVVLSQPPRIRSAPNATKRFPDLVFSQSWISNGRVALLSDLNCRQFILRPFVYDRATGVLKVLDRGVFTIEFPPAPSRGTATRQPRSDFKRMVRQLVMNYDVACGWTIPSQLAKRAKTRQFPLAASEPMATFAVGDGHSGVNEGTIDENGVIKIMGSDLVSMFGPGASLGRIALYASYKGEMPTMTPAYNDIPDGVAEVPLLRVDNGAAGTLDSSDYVLAYVSGSSDWRYDSLSPFMYYPDRYDDFRHYWLAVKTTGAAASLSRMTPVAEAAAETLTTTPGHYLLMRSSWKTLREKEGGLEWAWAILTSNNPSITSGNVTLPFADAAAPCSVMVTTEYSAGTPLVTLTYGGSTACTDCGSFNWKPVAYPGDNQPVTMSIQNRPSDTLELKSIEFKYTQKLSMNGKSTMTVFSSEQPGLVRYRLSGLGSDAVYIFRIGNNDRSIMLVDTVQGVASYEWTDTAGIGIRYYVCKRSGIREAPSLRSVPAKSGSNYMVRDLRLLEQPIDFLVITHQKFSKAAQMLVRHKKNFFTNPKAVLIDDVYDQFSGGNTDPAAVRNCLAYVRGFQEQNKKDSSFNYVVLMGAGHYDFRSLASAGDPSYLPVAEIGDKCVEDFFVYLHPGARAESIDTITTPDMFLGRMPCRTEEEAVQMVNKVILMEDPALAKIDGWRNRILLVTDDDKQGLSPDPLRTAHLESSERVDSLVASLSPALDIRKVYLFDYPWNAQLEKPEAAQALVNTINNGVSIVNYFGHGSDNVWADEHILMPENLGNLDNDSMYPLINSFSCSVGRFDKPGSKRSLSEYLVLAPKGGAIGTVSSTREAYASDNEKLAMNFYACIFDTVDSTAPHSFGQALVQAKIIGLDNNQKVYNYLGDPSISFMRPGRKIGLTIAGDDGAVLDTIKALQQVTIKGVVGPRGVRLVSGPDASYGADADASQRVNVQVSLFNPTYLATRKDNGTASANVQYRAPGSPLFTGTTQVKNGAFSQRFLIPKNVAFDKPGARLTAFAWRGSDVAIGWKNDILFHGYSQNAVSDTSGPVISMRPVYKSTMRNATPTEASLAQGAAFTDKISAACPFTLEIAVFDSNGVDAVSTGPDEGLTCEITGPRNMNRYSLNQKSQLIQGDYRWRNAPVNFETNEEWPQGLYKLTISAQDLLGNVSHRTVNLEIAGAQDLELYHVFNYPNPMRLGSTCRFYFDLSRATVQDQTEEVRVMIRLYTMSGRLLRVFENVKRGQVFDGRDNFGNYLSPGVYLYQISATDRQKVVKSKIEKLAINPPR
jgi:hypothetical protein